MDVRLSILVDGFNLFHSIQDLIRSGNATKCVKWLDLQALADSFAPQILIKGRKEVVSVDYFSAFAYHKTLGDPFHVQRHEAYIKVLRDMGVSCHIHRFKKRHKSCTACSTKFKFHEEKESDVAMAIELLRIFLEDRADVAVLVTGDTDIAPAVRAVLSIYPAASVWFAFPYKRRNEELAKMVVDRGGSFKIGETAYHKHSLPDPYLMKKTQAPIHRPSDWH